MIDPSILARSEPIGAATSAAEYLDEARECLSTEELSQVRMLDAEVARRLWQADPVLDAMRNRPSAYEHGAPRCAAVGIAQQHDCAARRIFLRRTEQLCSKDYPVQRWMGLETLLPAAPHDETDERHAVHERVAARYRDVRTEHVSRWLGTLPLRQDEQVYLARNPAVTLVLPWRLVVARWDLFYGPFACVNILDDDPRWFLFMHPESIAVWACSQEYATVHRIADSPDPTAPVERGVMIARSHAQMDLELVIAGVV